MNFQQGNSNTINIVQNNYYFNDVNNNNNNVSNKMSTNDRNQEQTSAAPKNDVNERKRQMTLPLVDDNLMKKIKINTLTTPHNLQTPKLNYSISFIETPSLDIKLSTPFLENMINDLINQQTTTTQINDTQPLQPALTTTIPTMDTPTLVSHLTPFKEEPQTVPVHDNIGALVTATGRVAAKRGRRTSTTKTQNSSYSDRSCSSSRARSSSSCDNQSKLSDSASASNDLRAEQKRKRNREAARKCRTRKLEKIANLQKKVQELQNKNTSILQESNKIVEEIDELKRTLQQHRESNGCVDIPINL